MGWLDKPERVAILIDGQNLEYARRDRQYPKIDFKAFKRVLARDRQIYTARYYDSEDGSPRRFRFHLRLQKQGYHVISQFAGNIDDLIITDLQELAQQSDVDTIVLVSSDSDFRETLEDIIAAGKKVEVIYFAKKRSRRYYLQGAQFIEFNHRLWLAVTRPRLRIPPWRTK